MMVRLGLSNDPVGLGSLPSWLGHHGLPVVQRSQHRNAGMHDEVPALGGIDQLRHRELPMRRVVNLLRQSHDVIGGILEREKRLALQRLYLIVEAGGPGRYR